MEKYGKIAVFYCKTETPAHTEPAMLGTTQHRQSREHSTTELTLERRKHQKTAHGWLSLSSPTSVYGKIAVSHCKTGTPAHTGLATLGTTQHRQSRQHSTTEFTLERRNLHTAGSAYPVLPVCLEKSQFPNVKKQRQLTQSRQRWEQPNTCQVEQTALNHRTHFGEEKTPENCTRLAQLIRSYQ